LKLNEIEPQAKDRNAALPVLDFKDTKVGKRVFLLGNGPPAREWAMADFKKLGADTIGMNRSWMDSPDGVHKGFQGTTYHCFVSGAHAYNLCDSKVRTGVTFAPRTLKWLIDSSECSCGCKYAFVNVLTGGHSPTNFKFDIDRGVMTKFAGYFALQLAAFMGYGEIFLVGYSAKDREGHAHDDEPDKGMITRGGMVRHFAGAAMWADARQDKLIVNCDVDSAIEFFPRRSKAQVVEFVEAADDKALQI
jgi:hypothetical protein